MKCLTFTGNNDKPLKRYYVKFINAIGETETRVVHAHDAVDAVEVFATVVSYGVLIGNNAYPNSKFGAI